MFVFCLIAKKSHEQYSHGQPTAPLTIKIYHLTLQFETILTCNTKPLKPWKKFIEHINHNKFRRSSRNI